MESAGGTGGRYGFPTAHVVDNGDGTQTGIFEGGTDHGVGRPVPRSVRVPSGWRIVTAARVEPLEHGDGDPPAGAHRPGGVAR